MPKVRIQRLLALIILAVSVPLAAILGIPGERLGIHPVVKKSNSLILRFKACGMETLAAGEPGLFGAGFADRSLLKRLDVKD